MSIDTQSIPCRFPPTEYLGVDADGAHRFRNELGVVSMGVDFLTHVLEHPELGRPHADAMFWHKMGHHAER